jgi:alpha-beta hydrolase superfamily lysophospholipase
VGSARKPGSLTGAGGVELHYEYLAREGNVPRAGLVLAHGYTDHAGRYERLLGQLTREGYGVLAFDFRGHGRSGGRRGHCHGFGEYLSDLEQALLHLRSLLPRGPIGIIAQSYGALVSLSLLADPLRANLGVKAAVLGSPFLGLAMPTSPMKKVLARIASRLVPSLTLKNGLDGHVLGHDPEAARAYDTDPLVHRVATARWFTETEAAHQAIHRNVGSVRVPTLWLIPTDDRLADSTVSLALFERAGGEKQLIEYSGMGHELWNEPRRDEVFSDVAGWLRTQLA